MGILLTYSFQIVAFGTIILGIVSSMVGCLNLFKGQSMIGDAMGHSTFGGIVIAFMLFSTRNPIILLQGAIFTSAISYFLIQYSNKNSKIGLDANLAIFMSGFFSLGLVLKSYIQGNSNYVNASQAGLEHYIFGQASYLMKSDIYIILFATIICVFFITLFLKEFKVYLFDREFAKMINLPIKILDFLLLFMTILVIGVGIKAVGAVLISSFLVLPCVTANQWTNKFSMVLILGSIFSAISSFIGTYLSSMYSGLSTGPTIILVGGVLCFISFIFGKNGIFYKKKG